MYRHIIILVLTISFLLGLCACKKNVEETVTVTTESASEITSEAATEVASGVADSIFDDVDNLAESEAETTTADESEKKDSQIATQPPEAAETKPEDNNTPTSSTEPTNVTESTTPETDPTIAPEETKPKSDQETTPNREQETKSELTEYEKYNAMSGEEQMAFMQSFDTIEAFFAWLNNAKAEYEAANPAIEIGDGEIDIGAIIGK